MFYSGIVALLTGQPEAACDVFGRCAATAAELGLTQLTARARQMLGYPLLDLGELAAARAALAEGVPISTEIGDRWIVQIGLGGFIGLAVRRAGPGWRSGWPGRPTRTGPRTSSPCPCPCRRSSIAGSDPPVPGPGGRPGGWSRRASG